ncbi:unnamed protein product [Heterosigma akashiwo]|mmetsp:Transcript_7793/g.10877  ORF Transcript_7793/g.10877 Transcript_7793/m.10877 type:complete len:213 (+) Transcript_7793:57-695(+)
MYARLFKCLFLLFGAGAAYGFVQPRSAGNMMKSRIAKRPSTISMALTEEQKLDYVNVVSRFDSWDEIYTTPPDDFFAGLLKRADFMECVKGLKIKGIPTGPDGQPVLDCTVKELQERALDEEAMTDVFRAFAGNAKQSFAEEFKVQKQLDAWKSPAGTFDLNAFEGAVQGAKNATLYSYIVFYGIQAIAYYVIFIVPLVKYFFDVDLPVYRG